MNNPKCLEVKIPSEGFYYSFISDLVDEYIQEKEEYYDLECDSVDFEGISKEYTSLYQSHIKDVTGLEVPISFKELVSPREYNFSTDEIYVSVSFSDMEKLHIFLMSQCATEVQNKVDSIYKSRECFFSYYSDFCEEWKSKPLHEWDSNELFLLMPSVEDYNELYESNNFGCNGEISDHVTFLEVDE